MPLQKYDCPHCEKMAGIKIKLDFWFLRKVYYCNHCYAEYQLSQLEDLRRLKNQAAQQSVQQAQQQPITRKNYKCPDCGERLMVISNPGQPQEYGCRMYMGGCPAARHHIRFTEAQLAAAQSRAGVSGSLHQQAATAQQRRSTLFQRPTWGSQFNPRASGKSNFGQGFTVPLKSNPSQGHSWANPYYQPSLVDQLKEKPEMKEVIVNTVAAGTIYELKFKTLPRRGYFEQNVKPIVEIIKTMIPVNAREYDPANFVWSIGSEYWPPLRLTLEHLHFTITMIDRKASQEPKVHVPTDYAENFYYTATAVKESTASIAEQLSKYLGVEITTQDLADLKKLYRAKAREFHPDLGGDAKKMSELNRLWTLYTNNGVTQ